MANIYTAFSFMLPEFAEEQSEKARSWIESIADEMETDAWLDTYGTVDVVLRDSDRSVWVNSGDESGDVEAAIFVIQDYLTEFDFSDYKGVYFSWATWCDKPRINHFYGGGAVVMKDDVVFSGSSDCCREAAEAGVEVLNEGQW